MPSTKILKIDPINPSQPALKEASRVLSGGGLVIIPTETVYGIAANALNKKTLERLYRIKQRPLDKPFSFLVLERKEAQDFAVDIPPFGYRLMERFWPGPLTLVLKSKDKGSVGIRVPDHKVARILIALAGVPLVCPSANISGKGAPVDFSGALADLDGLVDLAIDAGKSSLGLESTVVDATMDPPRILREGAIKKDDIQKVAARKTVLFICTGNSCRSVMAKALLEKVLKDNNRSDVDVLSAGIMMMSGLGATRETQEALRQEGIDVSGHRSKRVTQEMIRSSDLILVMERLHEEKILEIAPDAKNRLFLLKEFAKIEGDHLDIADPVGRDMEFYQRTHEIIREAVERVAKTL